MEGPISEDQDDPDTWSRVGLNLNPTQALQFASERK